MLGYILYGEHTAPSANTTPAPIGTNGLPLAASSGGAMYDQVGGVLTAIL